MRSRQGTFYKISNSPISIGMGNVLSTVSDKKIPVDNGNNGTIDWYIADITSASDYYPFGSPMDGRTFSSEKYRFGFNGKENDNEVKGEGNSVDFGGRIYDSRLGRWLSLDPLMKKYPDLSPYNFCANSPLIFIDPNGKEIVVIGSKNEAFALAADLNRAFKAGYKVENAFSVKTRYYTVMVDKNAVTADPATWINIFKKSEYVEKKCEEYTIVKNQDAKFDWNNDKYSKAMSEIIDNKKKINIRMVDGNKATRDRGPIIDKTGGGIVQSPTEIWLSRSLGTYNDKGKLGWELGAVALHELIYHIHTQGLKEGNDPNKMRKFFKATTGRTHGAGNQQSIGQ